MQKLIEAIKKAEEIILVAMTEYNKEKGLGANDYAIRVKVGVSSTDNKEYNFSSGVLVSEPIKDMALVNVDESGEVNVYFYEKELDGVKVEAITTKMVGENT